MKTNWSYVLNVLGSIGFTALFVLRVNEALHGGGVLPLLLAVQSGAAALLLILHRDAKRTAAWWLHLLSWVCAILPLLMRSESRTISLVLPGVLFSLLAMFWLGRSFSITPDDRGMVTLGPYRFIRHPMYAGELLSFMGICIASPSLHNWLITAAVLLLLIVRIQAEESVLSGYDSYKSDVRWRLVPYVW
jgi:protein-S-isoprenylcysteine O-methyltransferase Ste14